MYHFWSIEISHDTNQVLQDSTPQSTAQLLPFEFLGLGACNIIQPAVQFALSIARPARQSVLSIIRSYLVQGACYVIQLLDLLPSSVHHSAPISVNLSQSTMLVVATCWTRKRIYFTWTFTCTFKCTFILIISASAKRCLISE